MVYWLRMSLAICCEISSTWLRSEGKKATPPVCRVMSSRALRACLLSLAENGNSIDRGTAVDGERTNRLLQVVGADVVLAIGDDEDDALFEMRGLHQVVTGGDEGIVKTGAAASFNVLQRAGEEVHVAGEVLIEIVLVVEVDDADLVLRIAGLDQVEGGGVDAGTLAAHAAGVINDDAEGDGNIVAAKGRDALRMVVLEDLKGLAVKSADQMAVLIHHGGVQRDLLHIGAEGEDALLVLFGLVVMLRSGLCRWR